MNKKILILTNEFFPFKGGIGRYVEEVIKVIKTESSITLVAPMYDNSFKNEELSKSINTILFKGGQFKYWHIPKLINVVRNIDFKKYDSVLVADWPFWVAISILNKFRRNKGVIKFNLMLHGSEVLNLKNGKASIFALTIDLFKGIKTIFTNSEFTKRILYKNHTVPATLPVKVTYLGVEHPAELDNKKYLKGLTQDRLNLLTVGRLDDRKGHDLVIKAIGNIEKKIRDKIKYTVIGNGSNEYKESLIKLARLVDVNLDIKSGISDRGLILEYESADLFILAARSNNKKVEGFGLVFLEAAIYGVPSLATDVGAISEVVKHNTTGFVVLESEKEIATIIEKCFKEKDILIELSNNCIENVKEYTWKRLTDITFSELHLNGKN